MQIIKIKIAGLSWRPPPAHAPLSQSWFSGRPAGKVARPRSSSRECSEASIVRALGKLGVCRCESTGLSAPTDGREIRWRGAPLGGRGAPPQNYPHF